MGETGLPRHPLQGDLERPVPLWLAGQRRLSCAPLRFPTSTTHSPAHGPADLVHLVPRPSPIGSFTQ